MLRIQVEGCADKVTLQQGGALSEEAYGVCSGEKSPERLQPPQQLEDAAAPHSTSAGAAASSPAVPADLLTEDTIRTMFFDQPIENGTAEKIAELSEALRAEFTVLAFDLHWRPVACEAHDGRSSAQPWR